MKKQFQKNTKNVVLHAMKEIENEIIFLNDFINNKDLENEEEKHLLNIKQFLEITVKNVKKKVGA